MLTLGSTHMSTPNIPFSKSIPNSDAIMPSNRACFYDHNGTTFNSVPILEADIWKLPVLCLHILSQQPLRVWTCIIGYSSFKLDVLSWQDILGGNRSVCKGESSNTNGDDVRVV